MSEASATNLRETDQRDRRIRMLYSLGDFRLANSAATFLCEADDAEKYSEDELKRFRCYETTAIIAYTRPFSQSEGKVPRLTLDMTGAKLSDEQMQLHERLLKLRNKVIAHSDAEMMRMVCKPLPMKIGNDDVIFPETAFDEGLIFGNSFDRKKFCDVIAIIAGGLHSKLLDEAQKRPEDFEFCHDYLQQATAAGQETRDDLDL